MNTQEIDRALSQNPITAGCFRGVFAADKLPILSDSLPSAYVANCSDSTSEGTHWIAFFQEKGAVVEIFDSYGQALSVYNPKLMDFVAGKQTLQQTQQLQQELSTVCGQYAMFFIFKRASGMSYTQLIHLFTDNHRANDIMCCQYINQVFDLSKQVYDTSLLTHQITKQFSRGSVSLLE